MISDNTYKKFQEAVKDELGKEMDDKETKEVLNGLVGYFDLLMKIHHRDQLAKQEEKKDTVPDTPTSQTSPSQ